MINNHVKTISYVLSLLLLAVLAACGDAAPKIDRLAPGDAIVAFGDSITFGTGASESESYPAVLSTLISRPVVNSGVPGEVTAGGLARLPGVIEAHSPKLVLLCLGGNDMLRHHNEARTKSNLRAMIKMLKDKGISVLLIGVPKPSLITSAPEFYSEIATEFGIPYEAKIVTSVLYTPDEKADPIHPNAKGYRRMAEAIAALLKQSGAI
jgi:acyl-CoA thioesterase I